MKIKAVVIAILLVVNLSLLGATLLSVVEGGRAWAGTAWGQALPGSPRYLMVTGRFRESDQAVYVVNLESRLMAVFTFSQSDKRLTYSGRASLAADFQ